MPAFEAQRAIEAHRRHPEFHGRLQYDFTDRGISLVTAASRVELPWSVFTGAREDDAFLYLELRPEFCYFFPKAKLTPDETDSLRAVLRAQLGQRAAL